MIMAHLQYMPGDPRLVDQLVYELKSKGIFDQFRKDCIADVDTRPAYQNLRQRVENSVSTFLSRQTWQPELNKNQLREKLRKHILDGNYLEQGVERIVDQVVNPKVSTVFVPKVEDLVYNYLGIERKKTATEENGKIDDLLPTDLEAVSPGSVKSNEGKNDMDIDNIQEDNKMEVDEDKSKSDNNENYTIENKEEKTEDIQLPNNNSNDDKINIPLPSEEIKPENIPSPDTSPPKVELEKIELPKEPIISTDIPLPEDLNKEDKDKFFKPINSDDDDSSSDSSLRRNMSPLTPIRNFNNENSCDAQQGFDNDVELKEEDKKESNSFKFMIDTKTENETEAVKEEKKETEASLSYQFNNQVNINNFNTPLYEDSSNSNNLHIDYESDANSKITDNKVTENESNQNSEEIKKERKPEEKKSSHKSSHRSRDSHKHSSSKDRRSDSKHSSSRDSKHDRSKSSKDESKSKSHDKERSRDRNDKKDSRDSSRQRSSHKSSHKDSKSHRSSSSSHKHSSKHSDDKKSSSSSSSQRDKDKSDKSMDKPKDSKSSSHRSEKDRKGSSSSSSKSDKSSKHKHDDKEKNKKNKKDTDDHYSVSGRNNPNRRSTDRDSNDGSSSSKGSNHPASSKSAVSKKESKNSSKSESTSTSGDSTSPSDKENIVQDIDTKANDLQNRPVRIESHLEQPVASPPRLPFVPDVTIKKPKFAANLKEAKRLMKMRKFLDEEQKRMNQEAVLLLEFQANVRPSLSQVYSNISGPELEFACVTNTAQNQDILHNNKNQECVQKMHYTNNQLLNVLNDATIEVERSHKELNQNDAVSICKLKKENSDLKLNENPDHSEEAKKDVDSSEGRVKVKTEFEITIVGEEISDNGNSSNESAKSETTKGSPDSHTGESHINGEEKLHYFTEHEKHNAEIETAKFNNFLKQYMTETNKLYLINCDTYEENLIRDESRKFGDFEIVSYQKNGHLKLPKTKNVIKDVNISTEISLPIDSDYEDGFKSNVFSPDKSECSFELSDYDAKLEEMMNKASRQEIMEIILGNVNSLPNKMPTIDYFTDSKIDNDMNNDIDDSLKRKMTEETINSNGHILTPNKIRRLSTEQITSTTQENEERGNKLNTTRSKYLGRAKRVGLPRPKRTVQPNSPSSDKSVENYEHNTPETPNGKIKRSKIQRYDTSDLYKPKLHFLSRRNPVT